MNSYCPIGAKEVSACPDNTVSQTGSSTKEACKSVAGFYGTYGTAPKACPKDSYCPAGVEQAVSCPADTVSPEGSTSKAACVEKALYPEQCSPASNTDLAQFVMCMFRSEVGLNSIPKFRTADSGTSRLYFVGKSSVPLVDLHDLRGFRSYISATPNANYAWAILGQAKITEAGAYKFCITSDDG